MPDRTCHTWTLFHCIVAGGTGSRTTGPWCPGCSCTVTGTVSWTIYPGFRCTVTVHGLMSRVWDPGNGFRDTVPCICCRTVLRLEFVCGLVWRGIDAEFWRGIDAEFWRGIDAEFWRRIDAECIVESGVCVTDPQRSWMCVCVCVYTYLCVCVYLCIPMCICVSMHTYVYW
jgi:hypothetical protein